MNTSSRLWVKICANTSIHDAQVAADAGADAVGFVFASSPRQVTPAQVAGITPHLPVSLEKIGVFVDWDINQISATVRQTGLTGVQLHSHGGPSLPRELRQIFGAPLRILRVVHFGPDAARQATALATDANIDGILIDSRTATMVGGTGLTFDWNEARSTIFGRRGAARLIAAGGLTPANVREAIATLQPWGVDVASGVEAAPGRKDPSKVRQFVVASREILTPS